MNFTAQMPSTISILCIKFEQKFILKAVLIKAIYRIPKFARAKQLLVSSSFSINHFNNCVVVASSTTICTCLFLLKKAGQLFLHGDVLQKRAAKSRILTISTQQTKIKISRFYQSDFPYYCLQNCY